MSLGHSGSLLLPAFHSRLKNRGPSDVIASYNEMGAKTLLGMLKLTCSLILSFQVYKRVLILQRKH